MEHRYQLTDWLPTTRKEMEARGWDEHILADKMGYTREGLLALLQGRVRISRLSSYALSRAFGTSEELWVSLNRQVVEQLAKAGGDAS